MPRPIDLQAGFFSVLLSQRFTLAHRARAQGFYKHDASPIIVASSQAQLWRADRFGQSAAGVMLNTRTRVDMLFVPYKVMRDATLDAVAGRIQRARGNATIAHR